MPANNLQNRNTSEFHQLIRHWGTTAQRPTTDLVLYQEYLNVDIPAVQYWDGAAWQNVSGGTIPDYFTGSNSTGSTIAAFKLVASAGGANAIRLADSGAINDNVAIGFTTASIANGGSGQVQTGGSLTGFSGLTTGAVYYSDPSTPGNITTTVPATNNTKSQVVGRALSSTTLLIEIGEPIKVNTSGDYVTRNSSTGRLEEQPVTTGVTSVGASVPLASSGGSTPTLSIAIDTTNDGGAIAKQGSSPGTAQTGSARVSASLGADTRFYLNTMPILETGTSFPITPVNGQRYRHETYRSWFVYLSADGVWRQESPGVFNGTFPTVSSGDNTAAPKIKVIRFDRDMAEYFWNGTIWLTTQLDKLSVPFAAGLTLPISVSPTQTHRRDNPESTLDIYLVSLSVTSFVDPGTYDSLNYWTYQLYRIPTSGATAIGAAQSTWALGRVTNSRYPNFYSINTQFTAAQAPAFRIDFAKVGSPSTQNPNPADLAVRYVG